MQSIEKERFGHLENSKRIYIIGGQAIASDGEHLEEIGKKGLIFESPKPGQETDEYLKHLEFSTELL